MGVSGVLSHGLYSIHTFFVVPQQTSRRQLKHRISNAKANSFIEKETGKKREDNC